MRRYITREDAVFAACKVLDKFGGCKMGPLCPDAGCCEVRDIIDTFPMVEIPEKHGKLIEAEPIMKFITDGLNSGEFGYDQIKVLTEIQYAPIIIPGEEGKT